MIKATGLHKTYRLGRVDVPVLHGVDLSVDQGEWVAILGASGSGKSTLLHLLGGLDRPDKGSGRIFFDDEEVGALSPAAMNRYRSRHVGFVFQFYHLLPELTVVENVAIAGMVRHGWSKYGANRGAVSKRAAELLDAFGLSHRLKHRPAELSGGERQRVAIARALVNDPAVLLADEPTGNLDQATGDAILETLTALREERGQTIVMVTHDAQVAGRADRTVRLLDGKVVADAA